MSNIIESLVIGAGPAGIAAALQLSREKASCLLVDRRGKAGGLIENAWKVSNSPFFRAGTPGPEVAGALRNRLEAQKIEVVCMEVTSIRQAEDGLWMVEARDGTIVRARVVILATGTVPKEISYEGLSRSFAYEIRDLDLDGARNAVVIGGGDAAFDGALNLADRGIAVQLVMRGDSARANPTLREEVAKHGRITVHTRASIEVVERLENGFSLRLAGPNAASISCDAILCCIGRCSSLETIEVVGAPGSAGDISPDDERRPKYPHVRPPHDPPDQPVEEMPVEGRSGGRCPESLEGYLPPARPCAQEDISLLEHRGLFLAGDVRNGRFRQIGIAAGDGQLAAMKAAAFLKGSSFPGSGPRSR